MMVAMLIAVAALRRAEIFDQADVTFYSLMIIFTAMVAVLFENRKNK